MVSGKCNPELPRGCRLSVSFSLCCEMEAAPENSKLVIRAVTVSVHSEVAEAFSLECVTFIKISTLCCKEF